MDDERRIAALSDVPADSTLLFTARRDGDPQELILTRLADDSVVAFRNYCQHWTDVKLDKGSGALVRNDEIVCQKHAATFEQDSGYCNFGPCEGAVLDTVAVDVADDAVYLADDEYEFVELGTSGDDDLSSGSRIGFGG